MKTKRVFKKPPGFVPRGIHFSTRSGKWVAKFRYRGQQYDGRKDGLGYFKELTNATEALRTKRRTVHTEWAAKPNGISAQIKKLDEDSRRIPNIAAKLAEYSRKKVTPPAEVVASVSSIPQCEPAELESRPGHDFAPGHLGPRGEMMNAPEYLNRSIATLAQRAKTYDSPAGEKSIGKTVRVFNALTQHNLSDQDGWLFMLCLKLSRSQQGGEFQSDTFVDLASYAALMGEAADDRQYQDNPQQIPVNT